MREVVWVGSSREDLQGFPSGVRQDIGYALYRVQIDRILLGNVKVLSGMGSTGVREIRENDRSGTYRVVYLVEMPGFVFVLHAFQKKSTLGIATPKREMDIVKARLKEARVKYHTLTNEER